MFYFYWITFISNWCIIIVSIHYSKLMLRDIQDLCENDWLSKHMPTWLIIIPNNPFQEPFFIITPKVPDSGFKTVYLLPKWKKIKFAFIGIHCELEVLREIVTFLYGIENVKRNSVVIDDWTVYGWQFRTNIWRILYRKNYNGITLRWNHQVWLHYLGCIYCQNVMLVRLGLGLGWLKISNE